MSRVQGKVIAVNALFITATWASYPRVFLIKSLREAMIDPTKTLCECLKRGGGEINGR